MDLILLQTCRSSGAMSGCETPEIWLFYGAMFSGAIVRISIPCIKYAAPTELLAYVNLIMLQTCRSYGAMSEWGNS